MQTDLFLFVLLQNTETMKSYPKIVMRRKFIHAMQQTL